MTHDPMCDWWTEQCKIDCSEYGSYDPCPHDSCLCDLIAKVRDDEREQMVECNHAQTPDTWENEIPYCRTCNKNMSSEYEMGN